MLALGATQFVPSLVVGGAAAPSSRVHGVAMQWDPFWRSNSKAPSASDVPAPVASAKPAAAAPEAAGPWSNSWRSAANGRNAAAPEGTPVAPAPQPVAASDFVEAVSMVPGIPLVVQVIGCSSAGVVAATKVVAEPG